MLQLYYEELIGVKSNPLTHIYHPITYYLLSSLSVSLSIYRVVILTWYVYATQLKIVKFHYFTIIIEIVFENTILQVVCN